jgi:ABC-type branched-subunit amino acid transport system ATPase component
LPLGNRPELLILDEPTAGMSPEETAVTLRLMKRLSGELGLTILFCEHDMGMVFSIATQIMVMQQGHTIIQGLPDDVRNNQQVRDAYLGGRRMLRVENIHTYYQLSHILFDVSLEVGQGEIVCLLGRNGAGKSTTMKSIMGLDTP